MGWTNFIKIPAYKIAIEVNRCVSEVDEDEIKALNGLLDSVADEFDGEIRESSFSTLSLREIAELYKAYDIVCSLAITDINTIVLYWLDTKKIEYEIIEGSNESPQPQLEEEGYTIIPLQ